LGTQNNGVTIPGIKLEKTIELLNRGVNFSVEATLTAFPYQTNIELSNTKSYTVTALIFSAK